MKMLGRILLSILIVSGVIFLTSCEEPEDPIERVQSFVDDLRAGNYSVLYTHFDPSAADYDSIKISTFWSTSDPFDGSNYTINSSSTSGSTVTANMYFLDPFSSATTQTWTFTMTEDDLTWRIKALSTPGVDIN